MGQQSVHVGHFVLPVEHPLERVPFTPDGEEEGGIRPTGDGGVVRPSYGGRFFVVPPTLDDDAPPHHNHGQDGHAYEG